MKKHAINSSDMTMIPFLDSAIKLEDQLFVMDNLNHPVDNHHGEPMPYFKSYLPMKLPLNWMLIVVAGAIRLNVNFSNYVLSAGMSIYIMQDTIIEDISIDDDAGLIMLSFSHDLFPGTHHLADRITSRQVNIVECLPQQFEVLIECYQMLRRILTDSAFEQKKRESAFHCIGLMLSMIENATSDEAKLAAKSSRKDEIVSSFLQCVADNYRSHRELGFYADQLNLSLKYMSRVIHQQTGRHPSQWIKDYVVLDAKTMLRSGQFTVQQVADELNFPNQSFFGKYFKEVVGVSPKKWK